MDSRFKDLEDYQNFKICAFDNALVQSDFLIVVNDKNQCLHRLHIDKPRRTDNVTFLAHGFNYLRNSLVDAKIDRSNLEDPVLVLSDGRRVKPMSRIKDKSFRKSHGKDVYNILNQFSTF